MKHGDKRLFLWDGKGHAPLFQGSPWKPSCLSLQQVGMKVAFGALDEQKLDLLGPPLRCWSTDRGEGWIQSTPIVPYSINMV